MKAELIEAATAKDLTERLNNFLDHVAKEYKDEPYTEIKQPLHSKDKWRAFVFYEKRPRPTNQ
jgi:hypothetical protein